MAGALAATLEVAAGQEHRVGHYLNSEEWRKYENEFLIGELVCRPEFARVGYCTMGAPSAEDSVFEVESSSSSGMDSEADYKPSISMHIPPHRVSPRFVHDGFKKIDVGDGWLSTPKDKTPWSYDHANPLPSDSQQNWGQDAMDSLLPVGAEFRASIDVTEDFKNRNLQVGEDRKRKPVPSHDFFTSLHWKYAAQNRHGWNIFCHPYRIKFFESGVGFTYTSEVQLFGRKRHEHWYDEPADIMDARDKTKPHVADFFMKEGQRITEDVQLVFPWIKSSNTLLDDYSDWAATVALQNDDVTIEERRAHAATKAQILVGEIPVEAAPKVLIRMVQGSPFVQAKIFPGYRKAKIFPGLRKAERVQSSLAGRSCTGQHMCFWDGGAILATHMLPSSAEAVQSMCEQKCRENGNCDQYVSFNTGVCQLLSAATVKHTGAHLAHVNCGECSGETSTTTLEYTMATTKTTTAQTQPPTTQPSSGKSCSLDEQTNCYWMNLERQQPVYRVASTDDCAELCRASEWCDSFDFDAPAGTCFLGKAKADGSSQAMPSHSKRFCGRCTSGAATATTTAPSTTAPTTAPTSSTPSTTSTAPPADDEKFEIRLQTYPSRVLYMSEADGIIVWASEYDVARAVSFCFVPPGSPIGYELANVGTRRLKDFINEGQSYRSKIEVTLPHTMGQAEMVSCGVLPNEVLSEMQLHHLNHNTGAYFFDKVAKKRTAPLRQDDDIPIFMEQTLAHYFGDAGSSKGLVDAAGQPTWLLQTVLRYWTRAFQEVTNTELSWNTPTSVISGGESAAEKLPVNVQYQFEVESHFTQRYLAGKTAATMEDGQSIPITAENAVDKVIGGDQIFAALFPHKWKNLHKIDSGVHDDMSTAATEISTDYLENKAYSYESARGVMLVFLLGKKKTATSSKGPSFSTQMDFQGLIPFLPPVVTTGAAGDKDSLVQDPILLSQGLSVPEEQAYKSFYAKEKSTRLKPQLEQLRGYWNVTAGERVSKHFQDKETVLGGHKNGGAFEQGRWTDEHIGIKGTFIRDDPNLQTYVTGKQIQKMAHLLPLLQQLEQQELLPPQNREVIPDGSAFNAVLEDIKKVMEDWFDARDIQSDSDDSKHRRYFYYDRRFNTLIGQPADFYADAALNDHHFHYGMFILSAAYVARYDPEWAARYEPLIELLIKDAANWERDELDMYDAHGNVAEGNDQEAWKSLSSFAEMQSRVLKFPFLRHFDPYMGYSMAGGPAAHAHGLDQESSSESMNFASAVFSWGVARGREDLAQLGAFLYTAEREAIQFYWFGIYEGPQRIHEVISPAMKQLNPRCWPEQVDYHGYGGKKVDFEYPQNTIVFAGGAQKGTWWNGSPILGVGINFLPISTASFYLKDFQSKIAKSIDGMDELWNYFYQQDPNQVHSNIQGQNRYKWADVLWMAEAIAMTNGSEKALAKFQQHENYWYENAPDDRVTIAEEVSKGVVEFFDKIPMEDRKQKNSAFVDFVDEFPVRSAVRGEKGHSKPYTFFYLGSMSFLGEVQNQIKSGYPHTKVFERVSCEHGITLKNYVVYNYKKDTRLSDRDITYSDGMTISATELAAIAPLQSRIFTKVATTSHVCPSEQK